MTNDFKTYLENDAPEAELDGKFVSKLRSRHDFVLKLIERKSTTRGYYVYRFVDRHNNKYIAFDGRDGFFVDTPEGSKRHLVENNEYQQTGYPMGIQVEAQSLSYGYQSAEDILFFIMKIRSKC